MYVFFFNFKSCLFICLLIIYLLKPFTQSQMIIVCLFVCFKDFPQSVSRNVCLFVCLLGFVFKCFHFQCQMLVCLFVYLFSLLFLFQNVSTMSSDVCVLFTVYF